MDEDIRCIILLDGWEFKLFNHQQGIFLSLEHSGQLSFALNPTFFIHNIVDHAAVSSKQKHPQSITLPLRESLQYRMTLSDELYNLFLLFGSVNDNFNRVSES